MAVKGARRRAAIYIRVSSREQVDGYSIAEQEEACRLYCEREGMDAVLMRQDVQKGRIASRPGYQGILEAAKGRAVDVVVVYMFDRWGRSASERIKVRAEFARLGVEILSVKQGGDGGELMSGIQALMDEEYVRQLGRRVRPARERAAREGRHLSRAPYGYVLVYPKQDAGHGRLPKAVLEPDPATADTVRRLFAHYADGPDMTLRQLALWANREPGIAAPMRAGRWSTETLGYMLRNPVYIGKIAWNRKQTGYYDRAEPGEGFVVDGYHGPLVTPAVWDAVQERLVAGSFPHVRRSRHGFIALAAGLLRCAKCGAKMTPERNDLAGKMKPGYNCADYKRGKGECPGCFIRCDLAHVALLAQVKRLIWHPWKRAVVVGLLPRGKDAEVKAEKLRRLARLRVVFDEHLTLADVLAPADTAICEQVRQTGRMLYDSILKVEQEVQELGGEDGPNLDALETLHASFRTLATDVQRAEAAGDDAALRKLLAPLVEWARIVERVPEKRSTWARAEVWWTERVNLLFHVGGLSLEPDVQAPAYDFERAARERERVRAYVARKRAEA